MRHIDIEELIKLLQEIKEENDNESIYDGKKPVRLLYQKRNPNKLKQALSFLMSGTCLGKSKK